MDARTAPDSTDLNNSRDSSDSVNGGNLNNNNGQYWLMD